MGNSKSRLDYIDISKAILMILVVFGHVLNYINPDYSIRIYRYMSEFIIVFHMSAFFIISGMLYNKDKWQSKPFFEFLIRKIRTLIVPYVFFELFAIFWKIVILRNGLTISKGILNLVTLRCNIGADWFLPAIFIGEIVFHLFIKVENKVLGITIVVLTIVLSIVLPHNQLIIVIGRGMSAFICILIGYWFKQYFMSDKLKNWRVRLGSFVLVGVLSFLDNGNSWMDYRWVRPLSFIAGSIAGTILILGISHYIVSRVLTLIGQNTLIIMGTHQLVLYTYINYCKIGSSVVWGLLLLISIVAFELILIPCFNLFVPCLVGKSCRKEMHIS